MANDHSTGEDETEYEKEGMMQTVLYYAARFLGPPLVVLCVFTGFYFTLDYQRDVRANESRSPLELLAGDKPRGEACESWAARAPEALEALRTMDSVVTPYYESKGGSEQAAADDIFYPEDFYRKKLGVGTESAMDAALDEATLDAFYRHEELEDAYGTQSYGQDELYDAFGRLYDSMDEAQKAVSYSNESAALTVERTLPEAYEAFDEVAFACNAKGVVIEFSGETN